MQDNPQLLKAMLEDLDHQQDVYKPGPYWQDYSKRTANAIYTDGLNSFRANSRIGKGYADTSSKDPFELLSGEKLKHKIHKFIRTNPFFARYFVDPYIKRNEHLHREFLKYRDLYLTQAYGAWFENFSKNHNLPDPLHGDPQDTVTINSFKMGAAYFQSFVRIHNFSKHIDFSKITSVFEIGGGFGSFAHSLMHIYPNIKKYAYLDIPPVIYVSTQYLKHFYPDAVMDFTQTRQNKTLGFSSNGEREIMAICPWQIEHLDTKIDLFWNSASFQEMSQDIVKNYIQHMDRLKTDQSHIGLVAYRGGKAGHTILPDELKTTVEEHSSFTLQEFEADPNVYDEHFYLG